MRLVDVNCSIEGNKLELQCRKFNARPPRKDSILGGLIYPFKLGIFGLAKIADEFNPKKFRWCSTSRLDLGDELQGEAIEGHAAKPLENPTVKAATATHRASFLSTRGASFARIEIGTRALLQRREITDASKASKI